MVYTNYLLIKLMMITVKVNKVSPHVLQALWALHRSLLPAVISPNSTHILHTWVSNLHSHLLGLLKDTFPPANKDSPISGKMKSKWKTHWCMEESPLLAWMVKTRTTWNFSKTPNNLKKLEGSLVPGKILKLTNKGNKKKEKNLH